jgi:thymidine phosphorylase
MALIQEIIRAKRDALTLTDAQVKEFVQGVTHNEVSDAQIAAFCMAVFQRGMNPVETALLTREMAQSGIMLKWNLNSPIIDKHSTGGVGDKVSLMLAPMAASCGLYVPMIAGRGLGHTGGTVDKLDSIPGFRTNLSIDAFQKIVGDIGCAIIGQTAQFAPADKRIYAVRDVTATVESIPLITASILSKKLAAGLQGLVLDVKYGNGAFMQDKEKAQQLADSLFHTAREAGLKLKPVLTDMNQVLGHAAGNAVEVIETVEYLTGARRDTRLHEVTLLLVAEMLVLGGKAKEVEEGRQQAQASLNSGRAAEIFGAMIAAQGGPPDFVENYPRYLKTGTVVIDILADRDGVLAAMDTRAIGNLLVELKAGRARAEDTIDPSIGFTEIAPPGTTCEKGRTLLARAHLAQPDDRIAARYTNLLRITEK